MLVTDIYIENHWKPLSKSHQHYCPRFQTTKSFELLKSLEPRLRLIIQDEQTINIFVWSTLEEFI